MRISHICLSCGTDLARERGSREPIYGLFVVMCPRCGRVAPRRVQRDVLYPMRRIKLVISLIVLAFAQVLVFVGLSQVFAYWVESVQFTSRGDWVVVAWFRLVGTAVGVGGPVNPALLAVWRGVVLWGVGLGVAVGILLALLVHHLSRAMRVAVIFGVVAIALFVGPLLEMGVGVDARPIQWCHVRTQWATGFGGLIVLGTLVPFVLVGIMLGDRLWRAAARSVPRARRRLIARRTRRILDG